MSAPKVKEPQAQQVQRHQVELEPSTDAGAASWLIAGFMLALGLALGLRLASCAGCPVVIETRHVAVSSMEGE